MKKIFLSLLFLLLISISSNASAQTAGTCGGSSGPCAGRTQEFCLNTCTYANGACSGAGTPAYVCSSDNNRSVCLAHGCSFTVNADANQNAFVTTLCNALKIVTGNGGKAFAAFAIISVGIGFFTGKISWGLMIGVTAGIAAMFGAPTIVAAISGGNALDCGS